MPGKRGVWFCCLIIGLGTWSVRTQAHPGIAAPRKTISASAAEVFALSDVAIKRGELVSAERLLELLSRDPSPEVRNEARYRHALLLEQGGHKSEAAVLLRRILDDRPDAAAVRLKLVALLQQMGEDERAYRELRALHSTNLPPAVVRAVDRLSTALQIAKPWGVQFEAAIAPDTNVNRASASETVGTVFGDFALDDEAKSGIGLALRGVGRARHRVNDRITLTAGLSGDAALYKERRFTDLTAGMFAGSEIMVGRTRIGAEAAVAAQWYGMAPYQRTARISAAVVQPVGSVSQVRFEPSLRWTDDRTNDLRDGRGVTGRIRYERAVSPDTGVAFSITADRFSASDDAYSTKSWLIGATAFRDVGRMTISVGAEGGYLTADKRLAILAHARRDKLIRLSVGSVFRQLTVAGFAPLFRLVVERNRSTVEFYDFKRTRTEFGISRAF